MECCHKHQPRKASIADTKANATDMDELFSKWETRLTLRLGALILIGWPVLTVGFYKLFELLD